MVDNYLLELLSCE